MGEKMLKLNLKKKLVTRKPCYHSENRDAAVNFDSISFYNGIVRAVSLPQHGFFVGLCLQTAVNYLSNSNKYQKEPIRSHI